MDGDRVLGRTRAGAALDGPVADGDVRTQPRRDPARRRPVDGRRRRRSPRRSRGRLGERPASCSSPTTRVSDPADEKVYRTLVDRLRQDNADVVMLQDFVTTPALREVLASKDDKAWILPVGLAGELGTPGVLRRLHAGLRHRRPHRRRHLADREPDRARGDRRRPDRRGRQGPACRSSWRSRCCCCSSWLIIYRNPVTMMLPLMTIGVVADDRAGRGRRRSRCSPAWRSRTRRSCS